MNQNRPFFSTNTNLYNESFRSSAPATLNGQNVLLSQEQQRRIYDTLSTAIVGNNVGLNTNCPGNINVLQAQKQFFPGGVTFTFNQQQSNPQNGPAMCCKCPVPNAVVFDQNNFHSGANTSFPMVTDNQMFGGVKPQGLDCFNYQQQLSKNPFLLNFHNDHSTSCSDLLSHYTQIPGSQGYPDFCNISSAPHQNQKCPDNNNCGVSVCNPPMLFPSPQIEFSSNARKLVLSKNVPPCCPVDGVAENDKNDHSVVCVTRSEKSSQINSPCKCDARKYKNRPKKTKKQNHQCATGKHTEQEQNDKKQSICDTSSSDTSSSDCDHNSECEKPKKQVRWCSNNQSDECSQSYSSDTESDSCKSNEKGRKKTKKG